MNKQIIPIVFTPDENFIVQTCVAVLSMIRSKKPNTNYFFYLVIAAGFREEKLVYLERLLKIAPDFQYKIVEIDSTRFEHLKITTAHLSSSAYYRLILAELFQEDRVMYHDGDIYVNGDLSEMFEVDLRGGYVAGVRAIGMLQNTEKKRKLLQQWNFNSTDDYIFSGDLVFNLKKIREDGKSKEFIEHMEKGYPSEDQDVINFCCYGKIVHLPLKYCMLNRWLYNNALYEYEVPAYSLDEIDEAIKSPVIIHFAGSDTKPWVNLRAAYGKEWWKLARELLSEAEYMEWRNKAEFYTERRDWTYYEKQLEKITGENKTSRPIIIFGAGKAGKELCEALKANGYKVVCFADNDQKKWNQKYDGISVLNPVDSLRQYRDAVVMISNQSCRKEIREQIIASGVSEERLLNYYYKGEIYYQAISPEFRKLEAIDQMKRKGISLSKTGGGQT